MQKLNGINLNLIHIRNKVSDRYRELSPELFNDNKTIKENDDLLEARLLRGVDDETYYSIQVIKLVMH